MKPLMMETVDPEILEIIRERQELIDIFTKEINLFKEQAVGLDMNGKSASRYLATRLVESITEGQ